MTKPNINVTPLIDVLLVLLIIFMVIPQSRPASLEARLPSETRSPYPVDPNPLALVVELKSDSTIWINYEKTGASMASPDALISRLREIFELRAKNVQVAEGHGDRRRSDIEKTVVVKAPRNAPYGDIARLLDAVKSTGAEPVGLQIDDLDR